jgi:hypothetical protein
MELRYTETNAADDSSGRAFGLEGDLYMPLVVGLVASIGLVGMLVLIGNVSLPLAALVGGIPLGVTVGWIIGLRRGRPAGFDRDWLEHVLGVGSFSRGSQEGAGK